MSPSAKQHLIGVCSLFGRIHRCARFTALSVESVKAYVGIVDLTDNTIMHLVHVPDIQPPIVSSGKGDLYGCLVCGVQ